MAVEICRKLWYNRKTEEQRMNLRFAYCDDDKSLGDQVEEYVNRL